MEKAKHFIVSILYKLPTSSNYPPKNFIELLTQKLDLINNEKKELIIVGNLNINYLKRCDQTALKDLFAVYGFDQLITSPTRITKGPHLLMLMFL